ncbi:hypothetical protein Fmac_029554 [Flemingia macrophylla]|uniref:Uncharacterized protein n=1 Tax=Flemingia macrophylla TaxID=520843 RepID=A0ABD1LCB2_9FABA
MMFCYFKASFGVIFYSLLIYFLALKYSCVDANSTLVVNASTSASSRRISDTFLGAFLEEINHAAAGGLWAELVSNRGFEAGGPNNTSNIDPWTIIGNESLISNIEEGKRYRVVYHVTSAGKADFQLSFTGVDVITVSSNIA